MILLAILFLGLLIAGFVALSIYAARKLPGWMISVIEVAASAVVFYLWRRRLSLGQRNIWEDFE